MTTVTLSSKNKIVVPKAVRQQLGLKSGDKLVISKTSDNKITLAKEPTIEDFLGIVPPLNDIDPVDRIRELRDNWRASDDIR